MLQKEAWKHLPERMGEREAKASSRPGLRVWDAAV